MATPSNKTYIASKAEKLRIATPLSRKRPQGDPMEIVGIDEAGRGAVLGNLVIAGLSFRKEDETKLTKMGIKDSKKLTAKQRDSLYPRIMGVCTNCKIMEISPQKIDDHVLDPKSNLNLLEIYTMSEIINALQPSVVYIDALTSDAKKFTDMLKRHLVQKNIIIIAENNADELYPIVSAASIIAKVNRDRSLNRLKKEFNLQDIGSGYPSDPKTIDALYQWIKDGNIPSFVRKSWQTLVKIRNAQKDTKITQFFQGER